MKAMSAESLQYVYFPVSNELPDGSTVDPTSDAVSLAFLAEGAVPDGTETWVAAGWYANTAAGYYIEILVGPNAAFTGTAGETVDVWAKVTATPEAPVFPVGSIEFLPISGG